MVFALKLVKEFFFQLYNGLELKGQPYFADNLHNYNGRLYHSETNLLGILLDFHFRPPYKHPRYNISYMAVGKLLKKNRKKVLLVWDGREAQMSFFSDFKNGERFSL